MLNPAKIAREMKRVVEEVGVEVRKRSVVTRITPGRLNFIDTELGEIRALILVIGLNAYAHKLGFFQNRVIPISVFQVATHSLSKAQWSSIGWSNRQGLSNLRVFFSSSVPTADGRIAIGGSDVKCYQGDSLHSGNDINVTHRIRKDLFAFFPQLEGLKIEHTCGGTTPYTLGGNPSEGVMGERDNIYYGMGLSDEVPSTQSSGRIISNLMAGESNEFTTQYIVNRTIPYVGPKRVRSTFARGTKWVLNNDSKSL